MYTTQSRTIQALPQDMAAGRTTTWLRECVRSRDVQSLLLLLFAVSLLFLTAPRSGNFWFPDAPRHAMDGAFIRDLIVSFPITHFQQWAMNYYLHYPASGILYYPPLFALVEGIFFLVFGVSQFSAQLTVAVFYMIAGAGAYAIARLWADRMQAFVVCLLFVGAHGIALWGRQVMLEIPTAAFVLWSSYFLLLYLKTTGARYLSVAAILLTAALYTKQTAVFMPVAFLIAVYAVKRDGIFRDSHLRFAALLVLLLTLPLVLLTLRFGTRHFVEVTGGSAANYANIRLHLASWLFYARALPRQVGWPIVALACIYPILSLASHNWGMPKYMAGLLSSWFIVGYLFFSALSVHDPRHLSLILFPLVAFAGSTVFRLLPFRASRYAVLAGAIALFGHTLLSDPVPRIEGYREAADYVGSHARKGSVILFSGSGWGGGAFIFNLRARYESKNLVVLRSDRVLYHYTWIRGRKSDEVDVTQRQIADMLDSYGVSYIVSRPDYWNDRPNMQRLHAITQTPQFKKVADLAVTTNGGNAEDPGRRLEVYENLKPVPNRSPTLRLIIPDLSLTIVGPLEPAATSTP